MNIQIYGKSKCFDTKKAERWFKERRIKYQSVDLLRYGLSDGEYASVKKAVGGWRALLDPKTDAGTLALFEHLAFEADVDSRLLDDPRLLRMPIVRNGRLATVGYAPEVWEKWQ